MSNRSDDLISIVQRSYDLCAGLYEHVNRFPRAQRGLLGRVVLDDALQMLTLFTVANRRSQKSEALAEASGRLDALRMARRAHRPAVWRRGPRTQGIERAPWWLRNSTSVEYSACAVTQ